MLFGASCAALLVACAARPPVTRYDAPHGGDTARLAMRAVVPPGDVYAVAVLGDAERCGQPQLVGSGNAVQHPESTTLVAGRPTTVEFQLFKPSKKSCNIRWTFTPVAGKAYLLNGSALPVGCRAVLDDMSDIEHIKPDPGALRRNPAGGPSCLPIAESKSIPAAAAAASAASASEAVLREGATSRDLEGLIAP